MNRMLPSFTTNTYREREREREVCASELTPNVSDELHPTVMMQYLARQTGTRVG